MRASTFLSFLAVASIPTTVLADAYKLKCAMTICEREANSGCKCDGHRLNNCPILPNCATRAGGNCKCVTDCWKHGKPCPILKKRASRLDGSMAEMDSEVDLDAILEEM